MSTNTPLNISNVFSPELSANQSTGNDDNLTTSNANAYADNSATDNLNAEIQAILSPLASRYAFDPANNTLLQQQNGLQNLDVLSPLLASQITSPNDLNFASLNLNSNPVNPNIISSPPPGYGTENDIPAFQPETEMLLENFTNDLKVFSNWINELNLEEKKTVISLLIESINDVETIEFIKQKLNSFSANTSSDNQASGSFSPALLANTSSFPHHLRPVSPIIPASMSNINVATLDSILNSNGNANVTDNNGSISLLTPAPKRVLSPQAMKTGFSNLIEPIERPKSAEPSFSMNNGSFISHNMTNDFNLDTKLQQSLNTINSRSMLDIQQQQQQHHQQQLNSGNKDEQRGRNRYLQNLNNHNQNAYMNNSYAMNASHINGMNMGGINGMNLSPMNMNNMNSINMTMSGMNYSGSNINSNNNYYGKNRQMKNASTSVPPNNRIRNTRGGVSSLQHSPKSANSSSTQLNMMPMMHPMPKKHNNNFKTNMNNIKTGTPLTGGGASLIGSGLDSGVPSPSSTPINKDIASDSLLEDIPAWLKTLRLHKYTDKLQHLKWRELVVLDDAALTELGVSTLGARNKLLKSFNYVRSQKNI